MRTTHFRRSVLALALMGTGLIAVDVVVDAGVANASTITVNAVEDSYIDSSNPAINFGSAVWLTADNSPTKYGYYKFTVTVPAGETITHVDFKCWAGSSNSLGLGLWTTSSTWSQSSVTWNNAPMANFGLPPSGTTGAVTANTYNIANVTSAITGSGTFTLVGKTDSTTGWSCASKENSVGHPTQLVITTNTSPPPTTTPPPPGDPVFVGAGDIAGDTSGDSATAALLDNIPGTVYTLGDNVYENGTLTEFNTYYNPTWGRHKARTKPSPGNHDYNTAGATGYYTYFGAAAGDPAKGYYSYNLGNWHLIVINSNIARGVGSAQEQWLRADLAASTKPCTLAYWHHPRFTSGGPHPPDTSMGPVWQALYDFNADVVLGGHNHNYERFAPQNPSGQLDNARGIREFVAGTGGRSHYTFGTIQPNSQVRNSDTYGVLKLTLHTNSYDWQFVPEAGKTFTDSGTGTCH